MKHLWDDNARELREAVRRAHGAYILASEEFKAIVAEGPSGLPGLDGTRRITNAARDERHALEEYMNALRAFNDYANLNTHRIAVHHREGTGHFLCLCGTRLRFGTSDGSPAITRLLDQKQELGKKTGTCPNCGRVHVVG